MGTTDKELLEDAAKAANIQHSGYTTGRGLHVDPDNDYSSGWWNPLENDGDALRLLVKLKMYLDLSKNTAWARMVEDDINGGSEERLTGDHYAATRRAIVRAAAETVGRPELGAA